MSWWERMLGAGIAAVAQEVKQMGDEIRRPSEPPAAPGEVAFEVTPLHCGKPMATLYGCFECVVCRHSIDFVGPRKGDRL